MTATLILFGTLGLITVSVLWRGYVFSVLWAWFVQSLFGLPALSVPQAIGVALVATALTHRFIKNDCKPFEPVVDLFTAPALLLVMGWIVRGFL